MNNRLSIACDTCKQRIVLRIGVGSQIEQSIAVQCPNCKQKIALELIFDKQNHKNSKYNLLENCSYIAETDDSIAINLHTELVYPKEFIHEKIFMPAMFVSQKLMSHAEKKGFFDRKSSLKQLDNLPFMIQSAFHGLGGDSNLLEDWLIIHKSYSLYKNEQIKLMEQELKKYSNIENIYVLKKLPIIYSIFYDFLLRFLHPNYILYNNVKKQFSKAKKSKIKFQELKSYYNIHLKKYYFENYLKIFNDYFKNFSEFNRVLLNSKIELHPEEGTECILCPVNFEDIDMFYGNAYEYITTHITIFTCINNILSNRKFNEFEKLTFKKYLELNKDSKLKTLQNNPIFNSFIQNIESTLRNASHHRWFYIDKDNPGYLLYRSGGTGAIHQISYIDYLYKSNILMMKIAIMALLEIKFLIK